MVYSHAADTLAQVASAAVAAAAAADSAGSKRRLQDILLYSLRVI